MENNIDYRDLVQTVTSNILADIKSQLASIQPGIVDDIVKRIEASIQPSLDSFANQLGDLQKRVSQLEQQSGSSTEQPTPVRTRSMPIINVLRKRPQGPDLSETSKTPSDSSQIDTQTRILLLKIESLRDYKRCSKGEWIIYIDDEKQRVFMIRKNGTDKKDITEYFKSYPHRINDIVVNGSDWIVKYAYIKEDRGHSKVLPEYAVIPRP